MSCLVIHKYTHYHKNYIYFRAKEDSRGKKTPSLLQVPCTPKNNDGDDDEDEHINVESDLQSCENYEVGEPMCTTRGKTPGQLYIIHVSNAQGKRKKRITT